MRTAPGVTRNRTRLYCIARLIETDEKETTVASNPVSEAEMEAVVQVLTWGDIIVMKFIQVEQPAG